MDNRQGIRKTGIVVLVVLCALLVAVALRWGAYTKRNKQKGQLGKEWTKLELILNQIQHNYVDSVDVAAFIEKTVPGILEELDPIPYIYLLKNCVLQTKNCGVIFEGIGIVFNVPEDTATVINVVVGGPSEKMGLQAGDKIIQIGEKTVAGVKIPQDSIVKLLKGPKGTQVDVKIKRFGEKDLILFSIIRDKIPVHSVDVAYMVDSITAISNCHVLP